MACLWKLVHFYSSSKAVKSICKILRSLYSINDPCILYSDNCYVTIERARKKTLSCGISLPENDDMYTSIISSNKNIRYIQLRSYMSCRNEWNQQ